MKIITVFNNNILLVEDKNNKKKILWGKGVGFGKKSGENIFPTNKDKLFSQETDSNWLRNFNSLTERIPLKYFDISTEILDFSVKELQYELNNFLIISLAEHIYFAIQRNDQYLEYDRQILRQIETSYPKEYSVAKDCINIIKMRTGVNLKKNEIIFLVIHFLENKIADFEEDEESKKEKVSKDLISIIEGQLSLKNFESISYDRIITHINFLCNRRFSGQAYLDNADDIELNKSLRANYVVSANIVDSLKDYIVKEFDHRLSYCEDTYLLMHVEQLKKQRDLYLEG